jgi:hypothetical protein
VEKAPDFGEDVVDAKRIPFKINEEVFWAVPHQPAALLFDLAAAVKETSLEGQINALATFMQTMLVPESYERLKERMRDTERPVSFPQLMRIMEWLMEQYSGRPTQQSSP